MSDGINKVIIFRSHILPWSETFIRDQMLAMADWRPILVGEQEESSGLNLDAMDARLLPPLKGLFQRTIFLLCRWLWLPHSSYLRAVHNMNASLVHAHFGLGGVRIMPYAKALGLPLLVTLHGYDINSRREWWEAGKRGVLNRSYPKRLLKMAGFPNVHFIAVSEAIRNRAIKFGIPAEKITVSYIGVDTGRFKPAGTALASRTKRILFVGRMVEKKAPLLLISAFAHVVQKVPDSELVMVGDGPLRSQAERMAKELALPVRFTGALTSQQVLGQLHEARVFCLPSMTAENGDAEGLPISLLEAQACGVPVVTTAHSGNPEALIEGESGITVPEGDEKRLAEALIQAVSNEKFLRNAPLVAREHILARFELAACTRRLERLYSELAQQ